MKELLIPLGKVGEVEDVSDFANKRTGRTRASENLVKVSVSDSEDLSKLSERYSLLSCPLLYNIPYGWVHGRDYYSAILHSCQVLWCKKTLQNGKASQIGVLPNLGMESVGERIKAVRKYVGLSQEAFARHIGISKRSLVYYEQGEKKPPEKVLRLISHTFGVSYEWLKYGRGEMWEREKSLPKTERELIGWIVDRILDTADEMGVVLSVSEVLDITKFLYEQFLRDLKSGELSVDESKDRIKKVIHSLKGE